MQIGFVAVDLESKYFLDYSKETPKEAKESLEELRTIGPYFRTKHIPVLLGKKLYEILETIDHPDFGKVTVPLWHGRLFHDEKKALAICESLNKDAREENCGAFYSVTEVRIEGA